MTGGMLWQWNGGHFLGFGGREDLGVRAAFYLVHKRICSFYALKIGYLSVVIWAQPKR